MSNDSSKHWRIALIINALGLLFGAMSGIVCLVQKEPTTAQAIHDRGVVFGMGVAAACVSAGWSVVHAWRSVRAAEDAPWAEVVIVAAMGEILIYMAVFV